MYSGVSPLRRAGEHPQRHRSPAPQLLGRPRRMGERGQAPRGHGAGPAGLRHAQRWHAQRRHERRQHEHAKLRPAPPAWPPRGPGAAHASGKASQRPPAELGTLADTFRRRTSVGAASPCPTPLRPLRIARASHVDNPGTASDPPTPNGQICAAPLGRQAQVRLRRVQHGGSGLLPGRREV